MGKTNENGEQSARPRKLTRREQTYEEHYREIYGTTWTHDEVETFRHSVTTARRNADKLRRQLQ